MNGHNNPVKALIRAMDHLLEIEELHARIHLEEIAKELNMPLGIPIGENILHYIRKLKSYSPRGD